MKTLFNILSDLIAETFEKTDPAAWKEAPVYRPGPLPIPVETKRTIPGKK